jgi:hypothetical protein
VATVKQAAGKPGRRLPRPARVRAHARRPVEISRRTRPSPTRRWTSARSSES